MRYTLSILLIIISYSFIYSQEPLQDSTVNSDATTIDDSTKAKEPVKDTVNYKADQIEYDLRTKTTLLTGNAEVNYKDLVLYADTVHLMFEERMLTASGEPTLIEGGDTVVGVSMAYNLKDRRGRVNHAAAYTSESNYTGNEINRSDDETFYVSSGAYSSCEDLDSQHYCFYSKDIKVIPNDKAISRPVILNVAEMPVLALPYFIVPLSQGRQSGWLNPRWGGNPATGAHMENVGYYWAPNDYTDFLLAGKIDNFRNYGIRGNMNYAKKYKFNGSFGGEISLISDDLEPRGEANIRYNHRQELLPDNSFQLVGSGTYVTSLDYFSKTSYDTTDLREGKTTADMQLTKSLKKANGSTSLSWKRTHNLKTNHKEHDAPNFKFSLQSRPLVPYESGTKDEDLKWFNRLTYNYSYNAKNKVYGNDIVTNDSTFTIFDTTADYTSMAGMNHSSSINLNYKIFKWINFTPFINISHSFNNTYIMDSTWHTSDTTKLYDTIPLSEIADIDSAAYDTLVEIDTVWGFDSDFELDSIIGIKYWIKDTVIETEHHDTVSFFDDDYDFGQAHTFNLTGGTRISTKLYGMFPIKIGRFNGFRHVFEPSVSYGFSPKSFTVDKDSSDARHFPGIGISNSETRHTTHSFKFSFSNLFQTKFQKKLDDGNTKDSSITLLNPSISTGYSWVEENDDREFKGRWDNISLSAGNSLRFVSVNFSSTFTPYDMNQKLIFPRILRYSIGVKPKSLNVSGTFWSGDKLIFNKMTPENYMTGINTEKKPGWSFGLTPNFDYSWSRSNLEADPVEKRTFRLSSNAKFQFTNRWSATWGSRYSFESNKFENHSFGFYCDLECWDLKFNWNPTGVNAGSFNFLVKIKKYPEIKWDRNERSRD